MSESDRPIGMTEAIVSLPGVSDDFQVFMAALADQSQRDLTGTMSSLIELNQARADTAEATLDLIREDVYHLFGQGYVPSPDRVLRALVPSWDRIEARIGEMKAERDDR